MQPFKTLQPGDDPQEPYHGSRPSVLQLREARHLYLHHSDARPDRQEEQVPSQP